MEHDIKATILLASRRKAKILLSDNSVAEAKISNKLSNLCVGDDVICRNDGNELFVAAACERKNVFARTLGKKTKEIAANVDHLFLVVAVGNLFQTQFIDRLITASTIAVIPFTLIVNKVDLGSEECNALIQYYQNHGINVFKTSAKFDTGLLPLEQVLENKENRIVSFIGLSGVGKSTLLNHYIPEAMRHTSSVREKSGTGRQTTTQAEGYLYERNDAEPLIMVDPPGIQNFGLSHLTKEELRHSFVEFHNITCEYRDCAHIDETNCNVKVAVENGSIARSRYDSYHALAEEIKRYKEY